MSRCSCPHDAPSAGRFKPGFLHGDVRRGRCRWERRSPNRRGSSTCEWRGEKYGAIAFGTRPIGDIGAPSMGAPSGAHLPRGERLRGSPLRLRAGAEEREGSSGRGIGLVDLAQRRNATAPLPGSRYARFVGSSSHLLPHSSSPSVADPTPFTRRFENRFAIRLHCASHSLPETPEATVHVTLPPP